MNQIPPFGRFLPFWLMGCLCVGNISAETLIEDNFDAQAAGEVEADGRMPIAGFEPLHWQIAPTGRYEIIEGGESGHEGKVYRFHPLSQGGQGPRTWVMLDPELLEKTREANWTLRFDFRVERLAEGMQIVGLDLGSRRLAYVYVKPFPDQSGFKASAGFGTALVTTTTAPLQIQSGIPLAYATWYSLILTGNNADGGTLSFMIAGPDGEGRVSNQKFEWTEGEPPPEQFNAISLGRSPASGRLTPDAAENSVLVDDFVFALE